jgi:hypothetical protein
MLFQRKEKYTHMMTIRASTVEEVVLLLHLYLIQSITSLKVRSLTLIRIGGKTEDENRSALPEQSNESGGSSEETDSMHVEDSVHDE